MNERNWIIQSNGNLIMIAKRDEVELCRVETESYVLCACD